MRAIVAVDSRWGIGLQGGLLFHLPEDLRHFRRTTLGKTIVMGRKTLETLPGGKPLPGRHNIVLTRDRGYQAPGATVVHSLAALEEQLATLDPQEVFLIGGDQLYHQLVDRCTGAVVTKVLARAPADTFFPNLDERPGWHVVGCEPPKEDNGLTYQICTYERET